MSGEPSVAHAPRTRAGAVAEAALLFVAYVGGAASGLVWAIGPTVHFLGESSTSAEKALTHDRMVLMAVAVVVGALVLVGHAAWRGRKGWLVVVLVVGVLCSVFMGVGASITAPPPTPIPTVDAPTGILRGAQRRGHPLSWGLALSRLRSGPAARFGPGADPPYSGP